MSSEPRLAAPCSAVSPIELTALTSSPSSTHSLHRLEQRLRALVGRLIHHPVHAGRGHQRRRAAEGRDLRVGAALEQQPHHRDVAGQRRREMNGVCPVKSTHASVPVIGSICRRIGGVSLHARVEVGALLEQHVDQREQRRAVDVVDERGVVEVHVAGFDRRPERRAAVPVHRVDVGAAVDEQPRHAGWLLAMATRSGVMPLASVCSMSAPASSSSRADSSRPSRAAYSSGVIAPGIRQPRPALGQPAADDADAVAEAGHRVGQHPARRLAGARLRVHLGALVDEERDELGMVGPHGHHQRRLLEGLVAASSVAPASSSACTASRLPTAPPSSAAFRRRRRARWRRRRSRAAA